MTTYKIVRNYQDGRPSKVTITGLTLDEAQGHCRRDNTHGPGWFDGYDEEPEEAVTWLLRLRQLQTDGLDFDTALTIANNEYPEG